MVTIPVAEHNLDGTVLGRRHEADRHERARERGRKGDGRNRPPPSAISLALTQVRDSLRCGNRTACGKPARLRGSTAQRMNGISAQLHSRYAA